MADVDALKKEWEAQLSKHTKGDLVEKIILACLTIQKLEAKAMQWVDVKERLPSEAGDYLVYPDRSCGARIAFYDKRWFYVYMGLFGTEDNSTEITHWMPLPDGPAI